MPTLSLDKPLTSNGYALSTSPDRLGLLQPSDPGWPLTRLHEQYEAQGYLWLKGLLDRSAVLDFRAWYFQQFAPTGLLAAGSDPVEGIYSGASAGENAELIHRIMVRVVRTTEYAAFCQAHSITQFYEKFLGGPVHLYQRKLIRYTRPADPSCTGAHYDMVYLRQGSDQFCSSWIPIGDTGVELGGLIYLEGSHRLGQQLEQQAEKNATGEWLSKDLPSLAERVNSRWLVANYEAGDMVVHSPYIIHASTTNVSPIGKMRLSTDIRYQLANAALDIRWGNDWSPNDML